jgi:hypothetical protein
MHPHMVRLRDDQQIVDRVIEFVAVPVMYSFVTMQGPSEGVRHYQAMLEDVTTVHSNQSIAMLAESRSSAPMSGSISTALIGTTARAEAARHSGTELPLLTTELLPATFADEDAVGSADAFHGGSFYHFDEDVS